MAGEKDTPPHFRPPASSLASVEEALSTQRPGSQQVSRWLCRSRLYDAIVMLSACVWLQVQAVLPLMALVFPIVWRFVDIYGVAKIDLTFDDIVRNKVVKVTNHLLAFLGK